MVKLERLVGVSAIQLDIAFHQLAVSLRHGIHLLGERSGQGQGLGVGADHGVGARGGKEHAGFIHANGVVNGSEGLRLFARHELRLR